jgi:molybdopterin converting factor small subunit
MPRVTFTANLRRHVDASAAEVPGSTVGEVLDAVFARRPGLRGYILDDQGAIRRHVVVFVGGEPVRDRAHLSDAVAPGAEITVMQALSGG